MAAGLQPFDSICHAMAAVSTGGFSTRDASIAAFDNRAVEAILSCFMIIGGASLVAIIQVFRGHPVILLQDQQHRAYLGGIFVLISFHTMAVVLLHHGLSNNLASRQLFRNLYHHIHRIYNGGL